jgi:hypothetical protein
MRTTPLPRCFGVTFWAGRPADPDGKQPQGYLIARRC